MTNRGDNPVQMQSSSPSQTGAYARYRLLSSLGGKLADAVGVVIAIKTLSPQDYGVIGAALGLMAVIGFINLMPEDILWRDLPKLRHRLAEHLSAYVWFWLVKFGAVAAVAAGFCLIYAHTRQSWTVAVFVFTIAMLLQLLSSSTLAEVPLFAGLRQQRGAAFVLGVRVMWLALLLPNFWLHSLRYYVVALAVYASVTAMISFWLLQHQLGVTRRCPPAQAWRLVRETALDFTVWWHLVGRARVFLLRGDLAILGGIGMSLAALGQYTVAISLVGFALVLPGVLENVAAVSFAHHPERRTHNLRRFLAAATGLAGVQFLGGLLCGRIALRLLHVADVENTFIIFLILLGGVSIFVLACPTLAYAICFRRMREVFGWVFLPAAVVFATAIWIAGKQWGVTGAAIAHAAVMAAAGIGTMVYVLLDRDATGTVELSAAEAESSFQE